ncbi:MAG TPA: hypothetical protein PLS71_02975, partial [Leptospiraceae bacterium]|nr:hypothetical protein [Leptospiraceae bacterium]
RNVISPYLSRDDINKQKELIATALKNIKEIIDKNKQHKETIENLIKNKCEHIEISDHVHKFVSKLRTDRAISIFKDKNKDN